jgi:chemotaxis protein CheD
MSEQHVVGISDRKVARAPDSIVTYALGSCVGVALCDGEAGVGGLAHIMLPDSKLISGSAGSRMKFADTGIEDLASEMVSRGADMKRVRAKIAGGANMFSLSDDSLIARIGDRNVDGVRATLDRLGIRIVAEDIGSNYGRTMYFDIGTGKVRIQSLGKNVKEI